MHPRSPSLLQPLLPRPAARQTRYRLAFSRAELPFWPASSVERKLRVPKASVRRHATFKLKSRWQI